MLLMASTYNGCTYNLEVLNSFNPELKNKLKNINQIKSF